MMRKLLALFIMTVPSLVLAASGEPGAEPHIPESLMWSALNFGIYAVLLFILLRNPIRNYFSGREATFKQALLKAEAARKEAEAKKHEIQERLRRLETTAEASIAQAKAEAEALKAKILEEAQGLSRQLQEDAQRTAQIEIERAKNELREELLNQSVALSKNMLLDKMAEPDQKRLQTEFVDKIQVVR